MLEKWHFSQCRQPAERPRSGVMPSRNRLPGSRNKLSGESGEAVTEIPALGSPGGPGWGGCGGTVRVRRPAGAAQGLWDVALASLCACCAKVSPLSLRRMTCLLSGEGRLAE